MKHCTVFEGKKDVDVYVFHEFAATRASTRPLARHFNDLGYTVLNCEFPGHGTRMFEGLSWGRALEEIDGLIKERKNKAILAGSSAGGALAITLAFKNPKIEKVVAISAPNQATGSPSRGSGMKEEANKILPWKTATCKPSNKDRFLLFHAENDSIVPVSELDRNKETLCLPDENVFKMSGTSGIGFLDHLGLKNDERVHEIIDKWLD